LHDKDGSIMNQRDAQQLFAEVHRLHAMGTNNTQIAEILQLRRATVIDWLKQSEYHERRGWRPGRMRKPKAPCVPERIRKLKKRRVEHCYLVGSPYVQMDYAKRYPKEPLPSVWCIDQVVREANLQTRKAKIKHRGGSAYLLYPVVSMRRLGLIQESADFIGKKYLEGSPRPVTIFSSCYYRPFKMYQIYRTEAEKPLLPSSSSCTSGRSSPSRMSCAWITALPSGARRPLHAAWAAS
jgi:hypothetical protein